MKIPLLILFCLFSLAGYSQNPEMTKKYFAINGLEINSPVGAAYYVIDSTWNNWTSSSYSFYLSPESRRSVSPRSSINAPRYITWYYRSGVIQRKGLFFRGIPYGQISFNYENGNPMGDQEYPTDFNTPPSNRKYFIRQYWDSLGNKIVDNGVGSGYVEFSGFEKTYSSDDSFIASGTGKIVNGRKEGWWKGQTAHGTFEENYEDGKLVSGTQQSDDKTFLYTQLENHPEFQGNMIKFINENRKYPAKARRQGIEGKVFVEFVVDTDGSVKDVKTIKGINAECDQEAERIVSIMPNWKPGSQRGKPVKVRLVLPIQFKDDR